MARKAKCVKAKKQMACILKYEALRKELKQHKDYSGLAKLPKNANPIRYRNRDELTGRPRGYMRKFQLSRITFREMALKGLLPGVKKASW